MNVVSGGLAGLLAVWCVGCIGSPPREAEDAGTSDTVRAGAEYQSTVTATAPESLRISLNLPPEARAGQPVPIVIRMESTGTRPLDLYLRGRTIAFDIVITHPDGEPVWQRLKDEIIPAIIQLKTLRPGEVLELKHEWDQRDNGGKPVGEGGYRVQGTILTDGPSPLQTGSEELRILQI